MLNSGSLSNDRPTIVTYRSERGGSSRFIDLDRLVKSQEIDLMREVYRSIATHITAYEKGRVEGLRKVEKRLYGRMLEIKNLESFDKSYSGAAWIFLACITFGISALIIGVMRGRLKAEISEIESSHSALARALDQMEELSKDKVIAPIPEVIQALKKVRLENCSDELMRLKRNPRIKRSLDRVNRCNPLSIQQEVAFARSLELREAIKATHYVVNHGQNHHLLVMSIVAKVLQNEFNSHLYPSYEPLRHESSLSKGASSNLTVEWFLSHIDRYRYTDHDFRAELICGDCYLESRELAESALYFFADGKNIANKIHYDTLERIVSFYTSDKRVVSRLCNDLVELLHKGERRGSLYSICVPKEKFDESCYFARPYGVACKNQDFFKRELERMQAGDIPYDTPQIRVLTHKIRPEEGFHVILHSAVSAHQLQSLEEEVTLLVHRTLAGL